MLYPSKFGATRILCARIANLRRWRKAVSRSVARALVLLAMLGMLIAPTARAGTYYWDTTVGTDGFGSVTGGWDGVNTFWNNDNTGAAAGSVTATPGTGDDLWLTAGTAGTITVTGTGIASSFTLDNNAANTITGGTLQLGGTGLNSGLFVTSNVTAATAVNSALLLNTNSTIQNAGTGVLTITGGIGGTGNLNLQNNGATANAITISTLGINNTGTITNSGSGTGAVAISSVIGANVTGVIQNSATSQLTLTGANTFTGPVTIQSGTLSVNTIADTGSSALGLGTQVNLGAGTLLYTGGATSTARVFNMTGNGTIQSTSAGLLTLTGGTTGTGDLVLQSNNGGGMTVSTASVNHAGTLTNSGTSGGVTISSVIGTNVTGVIQNGVSSLTLSGLNTFTGPVTVTSGTLNASTIADTVGSSLGLGTQINFGGGTLVYSGTTTSTARSINMTAASTLNVGTAANTLTITGGVSGTGQLLVRGAGNVQLDGLIATGASSIAKTDAGTLTLTNVNNSFTGQLTINNGPVVVSSIANSGVNSAAGAGSAIQLGQTGFSNTGTLRLNSATGGSTNRSLIIQSNSATSGGVLDSFVAGQSFILTGTVDTTNLNASGGLLTLTGAGDGRIDGVLADKTTGTSNLALTKSGTGTWTLNNAETYTGLTNITAGTLKLGASGTLASGVAVTTAASSTFDIVGHSLTLGTLTNGGTVTNSGSAATLTIGNGSTGAGAWSGALGLTVNAAATASTLSGAFSNTGNIVLNATGAGVITLGTGSVNNVGTITNSGSGTATNVISGIIGTNVTSVTQNSANSALTLSGVNTFTGGLFIKSGAVSGSSASAFGAGTITLGDTTGSANSQLNGAAFTYTNPISVAGGNTGTATISTNSAAPTFSGAITLNSHDLRFSNAGFAITASGGITGTGNVILAPTQGAAITLSTAAINNSGTISLAGNNTVNGVASVISAAVGSNVTQINDNQTATAVTVSPLTVSGGVTVNAGGTQFNSNSTGTFTIGTGNVGGTGALTTNANNSGAITISGGVNNVGLITNSGSGAGVVTISGVIGTNVTGVVQNSANSQLILSNGLNTFTTGVVIKNGSLQASQGTTAQLAALGTGTVTLGDTGGSNSATLLLQGAFATFSNALTLGTSTGTLTIKANNTSTAIAFNGNITGTNNITLDSNANTSATTFANVNNTGVINAVGTAAGALTITTVGANVTGINHTGASPLTITNALPLTAGLTISNAGAGLYTLTGGVAAGNGNLIFNATSTGGITAGAIATTGTITNSGSGTGVTLINGTIGTTTSSITQDSLTSQLTLSGTNTFTGPININKGQLNVGSAAGLGTGTTAINLGTATTLGILNGAFATAATARPITVNAGGGEIDASTSTFTLTGLITYGTNPLTFGGSAAVTVGSATQATSLLSGTGAINKTGAGTTTLSMLGGNAAISGAVPINVTAGTFGFVTTNVTTTNSVGTGLITITPGATFTGAYGGNLLSTITNPITIAAASGTATVQVTSGVLNDTTGAITFASGSTAATILQLKNTNGTAAKLELGGTVTGTGSIQLNSAPSSGTTGSPITLSGPQNQTGSITNMGTTAGNTSLSSLTGVLGSNLTGISQAGTNPFTVSSTGGVPLSAAMNSFTSTGSGLFTFSSGFTGAQPLTFNANSTGNITVSTGGINSTGTLTNSGTGSNIVTISSNIGGTVTNITQSGANSQLILSGTNSYTGTASISAGLLEYTTTAALPGYPTPANMKFGTVAGTLALGYAGAGQFTTADVDSFLNGSYTVPYAATGAGIGLDTASGNASYNNVIANPTGTTSFGLTKLGANTLVIGSANTYAGPTAIYNGTLSVASLNKVVGGTASGSLGAPTTAANGTIALGNLATTGTLLYTGNGETTDRVIDLAGATGGGTIDNSGTGALTFSSAMTFSGAGAKTLTLQGASDIVFGSTLGTNGVGTTVPLTITKNGTNAIKLNGALSTITTLNINGGTVDIGANGLTILNLGGNVIQAGGTNTTSTINATNGGILTLSSNSTTDGGNFGASSGNTLIVNANITTSGTGGTLEIFQAAGATGVVVLNGNNTITGSTIINSGVLSVSNLANNLGTGAQISMGNAANTGIALRYTGNVNEVSGKNIVLTGTTVGPTIDQTGTGNLKITGTVTASGAGSKVLTLSGSNTGTGELAGTIGDNTALANTTGITKTGTGTWILSGTTNTATTSSYNGPTTINGGNLVLASTAALADTAITINGGGTFSPAAGTTAGNITTAAKGASLTLASGGTLNLADGTVGNFNLVQNTTFAGNALTLSGGTLKFDLSSAGADSIDVRLNNATGTGLAASSGLNAVVVNPVGSSLTPGTYNIITAGATSTLSSANFYLPATSVNVGGTNYRLSLNTSGTGIEQLVVSTGTATAPNTAYWGSTTNGSWATQNGNGTTNWVGLASGGSDTFAVPGVSTNVFFSANTLGTGNTLNTALDGTYTINSLNFTGTGTANTAGSNIAAGTGGSLTIMGAAGNGNTAGSGITVATGSGANTVSANVVLGASQTWTNNAASTLTISGIVSDGGNNLTLTKAGTGVIALTNTNTYGGGTVISAGTLNVANGSLGTSGVITMGGGTLQWATGNTQDLSVGHTIGFTAAAVFDTNGNNVTLSQPIGNGGAFGLTKLGAGTLTLSATNTYTGVTTITAGTLAVSTSGNLGTNATATAITFPTGSTGTLRLANGFATTTGQGMTLTGPGIIDVQGTDTATIATTIAGAGSLTKTGSGTFSLGTTNVANTFTGAINVTAGTLSYPGTGTSADPTILGTGGKAITLTNGGNVQVVTALSNPTGGSKTFVIGTGGGVFSPQNGAGLQLDDSGQFSGTGDLTVQGAGNGYVYLNNQAFGFSGNVLVNSGTLRLGTNSVLGTATGRSITVASGGVLEINNAGLVLPLNITLNGTGISSGGALIGTAANAPLSSAVTLNTDSSIGGTQTLILNGVVSGAAALTKVGANTLVLANANTYTGPTTISLGTLQIGNGGTTGTLGTNTGAIANSGTLVINRSNAVTFSNVITGTGGFTQAGTGTTTLTAANTYTGVTNVNAGTLVLTSSTSLATSGLRVGYGAGLSGAVIQNSGSNIVVNTAGNGTDVLSLGGTGGYGYYVNNGGTLATGQLGLGGNSAGTGTTGVFEQRGGSTTVSGAVAGGWIVFGWQGTNPNGIVNIFDGNVTNGSTSNDTRMGFAASVGSMGMLNVLGATASFTHATTATARAIDLAANTGNFGGYLNLNGGLITTNQVKASNAGTPSYFSIDGGTLKAASANTAFITGITATTIYSGGATFDTNGFNVTIPQVLAAPSGSGLTSIPVTDGGAGYIGAPAVRITGGGGTGASAIANVDLDPLSPTFGKLTGFTITSAGNGYTSAPTITLIGGGATTAATPGTGLLAANVTTGGLVKTGAGTLTLSGTNTFTGVVDIRAGVLSSVSLANGAVASNVGQSSSAATSILLNGGQFGYSGTVAGSTDRNFTLAANGGGFDASGTIAGLFNLTSSNAVVVSPNLGAISMVLGGTGAAGTGAGNLGTVIADATGTTVGLTKTGSGQWNVSSNNTFTGPVAIAQGILQVSTINSVTGGTAFSNLGAPTSVTNGTIALGSGTTTGTLLYAGAGETTDRVINLAGTTGGGSIDSSGTGALVLTSNLTATGAGAKTLTLTGANTGNNTLNGAIVDNSGTNTTTLTKSGAGIWVLNGASTYTGPTNVTGGTLVVNGTLSGTTGVYISGGTNTTVLATTPGGLGSGEIKSATGAVSPIIQLHMNGTGSNGVIANAARFTSNSGTNPTIDVNNNGGSNTGNLIQLNGVNSDIGTGTITFTGGNGYGLYLANVRTTAGTPGTQTFNPTTAYVVMGALGTSHTTGTDNTVLDGTSTGNAITGAIVGGTGTNVFNIVKSNTSTWTLSGVNTYTGSTTVNGGILKIAGGKMDNTAVIVNPAVSGPSPTLAVTPGIGSIDLGNALTAAAGGTLTLNAGSASSPVNASFTMVDNAIGTVNLVQEATFAGNALTIGGAAAAGYVAPVLNFELGGTSLTDIDKLVVSKLVSVGTGGGIINFSALASATSLATGDYTFMTASGGLGSNLTLGTGSLTVGGTVYQLSLANSTSTAEVLTISELAGNTQSFWTNSQNDGSWKTVVGGNTNFATNASGLVNTGAIPDAGSNVTFTATTVSGALVTTLDQNFTINSLNFSGTGTANIAGTTIASGTGTNTLTINGLAVNGNVAGNGITVAAGSGNNLISAKVALGGSQTWTINGSSLLSVTGDISEAAASTLTKAGSGTLALSGNNSYTGGTVLSAGTLLINSATALGAGPVTVGTATIDSTATFTNQILTTNNIQTWVSGATLNFTGTNALNFGTGAITLGTDSSTGTFTIVNNAALPANTLTFGGAITSATSGTAGVKTLNIGGPGNTILSGSITKGSATSLVITDSSSGTVTLSGNASSITTLNLNGGANSIIDIGAGNLTINNGGANTIQSTTGGVINASGGGTLTIASASATDGGNNGPANGATLTINARITGANPFESFVVNNGTGVIVLNNTANDFTGNLLINSGTVAVPSIANQNLASAAGAGTSILFGANNTSTLRYTGTGDTTDRIISLAGTTTGGTIDQSGTGLLKFITDFATPGAGIKTLTLTGSTAGTGEIAGKIIDNSGTNTTAVSKTGTGTWTLSGANTYTGATTITQGTLSLTGTIGGGAAGSAISVNGGTLAQSATGVIGSTSSLALSAGGTATLAGLNTYTGATTVSTGTTLTLTGALGGGATGTAITVSGGAFNQSATGTIGSTSSLTVTTGGNATLNGANSYTGATTLDLGALAINGNGNLGSLTFGSTNGSTNVSSMSVSANVSFTSLLAQTNTPSANTITIGSGKTLSINGNVNIGASPAVSNSVVNLSMTGGGNLSVVTPAGGLLQVGGATAGNSQAATLDLTGLGSATINTSSTGTVRVNNPTGTNVAGNTGTLLLPTPVTGIISSTPVTTITAANFNIGDNAGNGNGAGQVNSVVLGTGRTTLNANTVNLGTGGRDFGTLTFATGNGSIVLRAADGTGRAAINIGTGIANTGVAPGTGVTNNMDLSGHNADLLVSTLTLGGQNRNTARTDTFTFDSGSLDVTTVAVGANGGTASTTASSNTWTSTVNLAGGVTTIGTGGLDIANGSTAVTGTDVISGNVNISGGTVTVANNATFGAAIRLGTNTIASGLTANGVLNLTGGTLTVSGNIIRGTTTGAGSATVTLNGGTLDMNSNSIGAASPTVTFNAQSGTLSNLAQLNGGGNLTKTTAGTLNMTGTSAYTGQTLVQAGTLTFDTIANVSGGSSALGAPTTVANGTLAIGSTTTDATLQYLGSATVSTNRVVNLAGTTGGATLDSSGTGAITFASNLTATGAGSKTLTLAGSNTGNNTISGIIPDNSVSNTTALAKSGAGKWILSAANTYTGGTTLSAGTLVAANSTGSALGTGSLTLNGGVFASATTGGSITGSMLAGTGLHTIAPGGIGSIGALTVGGLTLSANSTLNFDITNNTTLDALTASGALAASGLVNIQVPTGLALTTYKLIGFGSTALSNTSNFTINGGSIPAGYSLSLDTTNKELDLIVGTTGPIDLIWSGGAGSWSNGGSGWLNAGNPANWSDSNNAIIGAGTDTAGTITVSGTVKPTAMTFNAASTGNYTVTGGTIDMNATTMTVTANTAATISSTIANGSLTKAGTSTLTLTGTHTYSGATNVSAGTLQVGTPTNAGSIASSSGVTVASSASFVAGSNTTVKSLNLSASNANASILAGALRILTVGDGSSDTGLLDISGSGSKLDLNSGAMVLNFNTTGAGTGLRDTIKNLIGTGKIMSSRAVAANLADPNTPVGIGYALGDYTAVGLPSDATSIVARYTLVGDANLDGVVDVGDLGTALAPNYGSPSGNYWQSGDFNGDGAVDTSDLALLAANYGKTLTLPGEPVGNLNLNFEQDLAQAFASVPEPGTLSVLGLAALALLKRRNRKAA